jgi:hypothetical protein
MNYDPFPSGKYIIDSKKKEKYKDEGIQESERITSRFEILDFSGVVLLIPKNN